MNVIFKLNSLEEITFVFQAMVRDILGYDLIDIFFYSKCENYSLCNDYAIVIFEDFHLHLTKLLDEELILDKSIDKDIGYLFNRYLWGTSKNFAYIPNGEGGEFWVGQNYILWSTIQGIGTWLYQKGDKFIFEVAPIFISSSKDKSYRAFMRDYKPYLITTISREVAEVWLQKCEEILKIIESNDSKYFIKKDN